MHWMYYKQNMTNITDLPDDLKLYLETILGGVEVPAHFEARLATNMQVGAEWPVSKITDIYDELLDYNRRGYGIYMVINNLGDCPKRAAANIKNLRAVFIDSDTGPITKEMPYRPHLKLQSGRGHHAYWLVPTDSPLKEFDPAQVRLAELYGIDGSLKDLARLFRVAGFLWHDKEQIKPSQPVTVIDHHDGPRVNIQMLLSITSRALESANRERDKQHAKQELHAICKRVSEAVEGDPQRPRDTTTFGACKDIWRLVLQGDLDEDEAFDALHQAVKQQQPQGLDPDVVNAKIEATRGAIVEELSDPDNDYARPFESTHEMDVASGIIERIGKEHMISLGKTFFMYNKKEGIWEAYILTEFLTRYDKRKAYAAKKTKPGEDPKLIQVDLRMGADFRVKVAKNIVEIGGTRQSIDWFKEGKGSTGVMFADGWLGFDPNWVPIELPPAAELRCTWRVDKTLAESREKCDLWLTLLNDVWADKPEEQRQEMIDYLNTWIGLTMMGRAYRHVKALVFYGRTGSNGKSLVIDTIRGLIPDYALAKVTPHEFEREYYRHKLMPPVLLNTCNEISDGTITQTDKLKAVIGCDPENSREVRGKVTDFRPSAGHIFAANNLPDITDPSPGMWRRLAVVPFDRVFDNKADKDELIAAILEERAAITRLCLEKAGEAERNHYEACLPPSVIISEATDEWRASCNIVYTWLEDRTRPAVHGGDNCSSARDCFSDFSQWCGRNGYRSLEEQTFFTRLKQNGQKGFKYGGIRRYALEILPRG